MALLCAVLYNSINQMQIRDISAYYLNLNKQNEVMDVPLFIFIPAYCHCKSRWLKGELPLTSLKSIGLASLFISGGVS